MPGWQSSTGRLIVREPRRRDAVALASVFDHVVLEAQGWTTTQRRWSLTAIAHGRARGELLVVCNFEGRPIGTVSIDANQTPRRIGLIMGPHGRGQGLGLEAMRAALPYFAGRGANRLIIETAVDNTAMRRIAERLGAVAMTEFVHTLPNGQRAQAIRYALPPQPPDSHLSD